MSDNLVNRMAEFIQLERDLRSVSSEKALGFVLTNYLHKLLTYDVALFVSVQTHGLGNKMPGHRGRRIRGKVFSVSGVSDFDPDAPLVQFTEQLIDHSDSNLHDTQVHTELTLPASLRSAFSTLDFSQIATVELKTGNAVLVLYRKKEWQLSELQLLQQVSEVASHALQALQGHISGIKRSRLRHAATGMLRPGLSWVLCGLLALSFLPVRQSVIASGEVAPESPAVIASGLDAVVKDIQVVPNQRVTKNQVLINFDSSMLEHQRISVASEVELAKEKLRKARQQSLNSSLDGNVLSDLETQVQLKQLELDFIDEQMSRLQIRASRDGIVLFSRKKDWEGRAVLTGEKIMEIAGTDDSQFEIWLAANDAIGLEAGSAVKFFPDANPLQSVNGEVKQVGYFAASSNSNDNAYRVIASRTNGQKEKSSSFDSVDLRLGMKGTFRLYGKKVRLGYHVLRKPISAVRRTLGV